MKIIKAGKVLTSEALNAEMIVSENTRKANENARNVFELYNNSKSYIKGNKVSYNGSSYVNLIPCTGVLPTESATNWLIIASAGAGLTDASQLPITDVGEYYDSSNTGDALQEVGQKLNDKLDKTGDSSNNTVDFIQASTDTDITTGDSHATLFGKILKRFSTLATNIASKVSTSNIANNVVTTTSGLVLDARQGKVLQDQVDALNDNFVNKSAMATIASSAAKDLTTTPSNFLFDTISNSDNYTVSNGVITVLSAGYYAISALAHFGLGSHDYGTVTLNVGGAVASREQAYNPSEIAVQVQQSIGATLYIGANTQITVSVKTSGVTLDGGIYGVGAANILRLIKLH